MDVVDCDVAGLSNEMVYPLSPSRVHGDNKTMPKAQIHCNKIQAEETELGREYTSVDIALPHYPDRCPPPMMCVLR